MTKSVQKIQLSASRDIPFNKLVLSQANVRRIKAGVSIEELAEDIARRTLLQSITVRPVLDDQGAETGMFEIPAGGRRYRALELLVKQKRLRECDQDDHGPGRQTDPENSSAPERNRAPPEAVIRFQAQSPRAFGGGKSGNDEKQVDAHAERWNAQDAHCGQVGPKNQTSVGRDDRQDREAAQFVEGADPPRNAIEIWPHERLAFAPSLYNIA